MRIAKTTFLVLSLIALQSLVFAEPQIRQFFPDHPVLLGQPLFWTIKIQYPLWESYSLQVPACSGAHIEIADQSIAEEDGGIAATYRLKIVPENLNVSGTPSVLITDRKGQSTVLNGKPIVVRNISGASLEIQNASTPRFAQMTMGRSKTVLYLAGTLVISGCIALFWIRYRARSPRQVLLRELRKSLNEMQKKHLPFSLWRQLRSELIWGFSAEAFTAQQLSEAARSNRLLIHVAEALRIMERMRYAGEKAFRPEPAISEAVTAALELVQKREKR